MDLKLAQACYRFGLLSGADLVAAATRLIEEGSDNPTARELACLQRPALRDAGPLFERVSRELDIPDPTPAEAQNVVAADIGKAIVEGRAPPRHGLSEIEEPMSAAGDLDDLWPFDPWHFYDDGWPFAPQERADHHARLDNEVIEAARKMLARLDPEAGRR